MSTCTTVISTCGEYQIGRVCLPIIYQGDNGTVDLTLLDKAGNAIDLDTVSEIEAVLYGLDVDYKLEYNWPFNTGNEDITILQETVNDTIVNQGKIRLYIPTTFTKHLVSGNLNASIRITKYDTSLPTGEDIITFPCLNVAEIKYTEINFL